MTASPDASALRATIILTVVAFVAAESLAGEEKHFKRQEAFPEGRQVSSLIGSMFSGIKDVNVVRYTFDARYEATWNAALAVAQRFDKLGGRPLRFMDTRNGRIFCGVISLNDLVGLGRGAWADEFQIELTKVSGTSTNVVVGRKVVENAFTGEKQWKTAWSNGKIERWLLTQIEDELKNPSSTQEATSAVVASPSLPAPTVEPTPPSPTMPPAEILTNDAVMRLVEAKLPEAVILAKIRTSATSFDVSTGLLIKLKEAGVSDAILEAMLIAKQSE